MDKQRKRELKKKGKELVEEYSAKVRERLHEENPFYYTDPSWVENYKEVYYKNKEYRLNTDKVLNESELTDLTRLKVIGYKYDGLFIPRKGEYLLCNNCKSLVPTWATKPLTCNCKAILIDLKNKKVIFPNNDECSVVKIEALGSIRNNKPWWKIW